MSSAESHYDRHAGGLKRKRDPKEVINDRNRGRSIPLKTFHNSAKRAMIKYLSSDNEILLDLACGRGGDIAKWMDNRVQRVLGVDISGEEVKEASSRFDYYKRLPKYCHKDYDYRFVQSAAIGEHSLDWSKLENSGVHGEQQFDSVSCQFAAHYFFKSQKTCEAFLQNVSKSLKPGGYFYGIIAFGPYIQELLDNKNSYSSDLLHIRKTSDWRTDSPQIGSGYTFAIANTVTNDDLSKEEVGEGCEEYMVTASFFEGAAAHAGLVPVRDLDWDRAFDSNFDSQAYTKDHQGVRRREYHAFHRLQPNYTGGDADELTKISRLYCGFVFRKGEDLKQKRKQGC